MTAVLTRYQNRADLNGDGTVGPADMGMLLGAWGNPGCSGSMPCPADLNGDGVVNPAELGILLGAWGACSPCAGPPCPADIAGCDGVVNAADLGALLGNWGCCDSGEDGESFSEPQGSFESIEAFIEYLHSIGEHELAEQVVALIASP